jgi:hypothetical protein
LAPEREVVSGEPAVRALIVGVFGIVILGCGATVVAGENDEGVVFLSGIINGLYDPTNRSIEVHDAGGILPGNVACDIFRDFLQPFLWLTDRQVNSGIRNVEKKGLWIVRGCFAANPLHRFICQQVSNVAFFLNQFVIPVPGNRVRPFFIVMVVGRDSSRQ